MNWKLKGDLEISGTPYRVIDYRDSCIVLADSTYIIPFDLSGSQSFQNRHFKDQSQLYYYSINGADSFAYDFGRRQLLVSSPAGVNSNSLDGYALSSIENNGLFYTVSILPQKGTKTSIVQFSKWDHRTNEENGMLILNDFLKESILDDTSCLESKLEGSFFRISDNAIGYFFFHSSMFIIYRNGKFSLENTVVNYPFVKYSPKKTELGGQTMTICQPEIDAWVHLSAAASNGKLYFLSNILKKGEKRRTVDIYDARNMNYLYSIQAPNNGDEQPTDIVVKDGTMLFIYESGKLMSYAHEP